ncbi:saccharopine dehydrogenase family protein [Halococcus qingdaonensis]|uniref:saccharopine dehydrogenase family protein n=1 Tax=Halococcus qingdaonensis TaxID=224402 RepID=UPI002117049A|nr:saccharopine dehydrogenase NADP-binding domain-containing protein [Halococcus qingdaonensis]
MGDDLLIYGSYGYTGALITETVTEAGLEPTLAGRRAEPVERQATDRGLDHRVFSLDHPTVVESHIGEFDAVLNCAGPFSATADPLVAACIESETDYLDITGEITAFEATAERDRDAEKADVTLLPGVGFDVVPTDCLAAYLHTKHSAGDRLSLAIDGLGTFSPGTLKSVIEGLSEGGAARIDGAIESVPPAWKVRDIDLGGGASTAVTIPWGDVSTAYYTTGIPNVETYATVPNYAATMMRKTGPLTPLLGTSPIRRALKGIVDATVSGPTADERARSTTRIWGEVEGDGERVAARLRTPDTYEFTARTATEIARRVCEDDVESGFQTPASAFGPEFVLEFDGVEREDVGGR